MTMSPSNQQQPNVETAVGVDTCHHDDEVDMVTVTEMNGATDTAAPLLSTSLNDDDGCHSNADDDGCHSNADDGDDAESDTDEALNSGNSMSLALHQSLHLSGSSVCNKKIKQALQQEAYPTIWPLLTLSIRPSLELSPKMGEDLSEIRLNRRAKFHASREVHNHTNEQTKVQYFCLFVCMVMDFSTGVLHMAA